MNNMDIMRPVYKGPVKITTVLSAAKNQAPNNKMALIGTRNVPNTPGLLTYPMETGTFQWFGAQSKGQREFETFAGPPSVFWNANWMY